MEVLVVGKQQILGAAVCQGCGEDLLSQFIQGDIGDSGHALSGADIPERAGGGFKHNRVGDNSRSHHTGHLLAGH